MARYKAGEAEALIVPSLDGFGRRLRTAFEAMPDSEFSVDVAPDLSGFPARLEAELARTNAQITVDVVPDLTEFAARMAAATQNQTITVQVDADTSTAEAQIAATAAARQAEIQAEANVTAAAARLAELTAAREAEIRAQVDESSAVSVTARLAALARDREIDMNIDLDAGAAMAKMAALTLQASLMTGAIGAGLGGVVGLLGVAAGAVGGLGLGFIGLGTAAAPVLGAIALGTDGIKIAAQEAAPAFTALKTEISGVFGEEMKAGFQDINGILEGITPGMEGVASGLSGMFNSTFSLIRNDGMGELNALLSGVPPMLAAIQPGLDGLVMGFLDIGEAAGPSLESMGSGLSEMFGALGGAFTEMASNGTLTVIFDEMGNALGGVGAGVADLLTALGDIGMTVLPTVEPLFRSLGTAFLNMAPGLATAGAALGTALGPALEQVGTTIGQLGTQLAPLMPLLGGAITGILQAITPLMPVLSQMGATVLSALTPILPVLGEVLGVVGGALAQAFEAIAPALGPLVGAFGQILTALAPVLPVIGQLIAQLAGALTPIITALAPVISILVTAFAGIAAAVMPVITTLAGALVPVITALTPTISMLAGILGQVAAQIGGVLVTAITALAPFLPPLVAAFGQILGALLPLLPLLLDIVIQALMPLIPVIISLMPAILALVQVVAVLVQALMPLVTAAAQIIGLFVQLVATIVGFVGTVLGHVISFTAGVIAAFAGLVAGVIGSISGMVASVVGFFVDLGTRALNAVNDWWNRTTAAVSTGVATLVAKVGEIPGKVTAFFSSAGTWLYNAGKDVVTGLINGLTDMLGEAYDRVRGMAENITNVAKDALGIASPSKVFMEIGAFVTEGLAVGIENTIDAPVRAATTAVRAVVSDTRDALDEIQIAAGGGDWGYASLGRLIGDEPARMAVNAADAINAPFRDAANTAGRAGTSLWNMAANRDYDGRMGRLGVQEDDPIVAAGLGAFDARQSANNTIARAMPGMFAGAGGPRDDQNLIRISDGEFIVNAEASEQWRPFLDAINFGGMIPGFADGGDPTGGPRSKVNESQLVNFARGLEGKPYVWGGVNWGDCSGAMSAIARFATGLDPFGGRFATGSEGEALRDMGFENGRWQKGYLGIGWTNDPGGPGGGHTAGTLSEGTNVEMGGGRGNGQFGGPAAGANDGQFRNQMRIRVKDPFQPSIPGKLGLSGTATPGVDTSVSASTLPTGMSTAGTAAPASATPKSWSDMAADIASTGAKSATSDLLGIFGIEDEMPWWMQVQQAMAAEPLQDGVAPVPIADTPDELLADPTLASTTTLNAMPEPPKSEGSNHIWDPSGGAEQWRPMVRAAMKRQGKSGQAEEDAWVRQIASESGGNPGIKQGIVDVNSGGNEAVGLLQIIPGTFAAHRDPELPNDRRNAWANVNAAIRYGHARYPGRLLEAIGDGDGYKDGGLIPGLGGVRQDSIGINVSPGEYVSHAVATAANLPLFEALNSDPYLLHNIPRQITSMPRTGGGGGIDASVNIGQVVAADWDGAQRALQREQGRQVRNLSMAGSVTG